MCGHQMLAKGQRFRFKKMKECKRLPCAILSNLHWRAVAIFPSMMPLSYNCQLFEMEHWEQDVLLQAQSLANKRRSSFREERWVMPKGQIQISRCKASGIVA